MIRWHGVARFLLEEAIIPRLLLIRFCVVVGISNWLFLGSACQTVQAQPLSLWRIDNNDARVYLLGSVHALRPDVYPLAAEIDAAFEESDKTVFEVDLSLESSYQVSALMQQKGTYPHPQTIDSQISPATLERLKAYFSSNNLQISDFRRMRPWLISLQIGIYELGKLGYDPDLGIDLYYQKKARASGKPIMQLETLAEQIDLLAGDPVDTQDISLRALLEEIDDMDSQIKDLMAAWQQGAVDHMYELSTRSSQNYPELVEQLSRLLDQRNARMAEKINAYLNTKQSYFVVIGALHMGGPNGILALLGKDHRIVQLQHSRK